MPDRKILILDGHPAKRSLSRLFADTYATAARKAGFPVKVLHLSDLAFDMDFGQGNYHSFKPLEPALQDFMDKVSWSDHFVLIAPMWWGGLPAKLKGLFDRAFVPGLAFDPRNTRFGMPSPMLTGRSARFIVTSDTPMWVLRLMYRRAILFAVQRQIFKFVGMKPNRAMWFSGASEADEGKIARWVGQVEQAGLRGA